MNRPDADRPMPLAPHWLQEHGFAHVVKVGKKRAGRLLDGVLHDEFPTTENLHGV